MEIADVIRRLRKGIGHKELDVRALMIGGHGGAFCGVGDVKGMARKKIGLMMHGRMTDMQDWFHDLIKLEMLVIAAVDGPAFGHPAAIWTSFRSAALIGRSAQRLILAGTTILMTDQ
ncbi:MULTISPECIES: enoyl-CoA hydratase/isomerase family protein [Paraburkholderia]|uniref:Enoyl-CoA hydratase/isomerase-like protein n=1 Tax=Paraburkholderia podalyriae TaxID=1938811 RepID=A0ABR7Q2F3_9BURK|nr:hypothetical protein [Paraburkholderia podalyriae]MBC8752735.1 hypothetical protein [Paraburkholderia podalyriae]